MILFTTCKPFTGNSCSVQCLSLTNWRRVCPQAEIIVFGRCDGFSKICQELKIRQVENLKCTKSGIPYFGAMVDWLSQSEPVDVQIYLNADILLPPDFCSYVGRVSLDRFLMVGQRIDLKEDALFDPDDFYAQLRQVLQLRQAEIHRPSGMDFFIFRQGMWKDLKPLIVGRGGYDSALVVDCLRKKIPVIDASFAFPVVHQWHAYTHIRDGKKQAHYGSDANLNFQMHKLRDFAPHCVDADWMMTRQGAIVPNRRRSLPRKLETEWYYKQGFEWCPKINQLWNLVTRGGKCIKNPDWGR